MKTFSEIWEIALARKGEEALNGRIADATAANVEDLAATTDDRWLSMMARRVFAAGSVWRVIEAKWDGFEGAFRGFDPITLDKLASQAALVRWAQESGRPLAEVSMIAACSIDAPRA